MRRAVFFGMACAFLASACPSFANVPQAQIRGKVSLGRNRPVVGAVVLVRSETDPGPIWVTASDQDGRFRLEGIPDGSYRVVIRRDGLTPYEQSGLVLKAPFRAIVEAMLEVAESPRGESRGVEFPKVTRMVRIDGTVVGPEGDPAVGAEFRLVRDDGSLDPRETRVGPDGGLVVNDLASGRWRVELLEPGAVPLRVTVDIVEDAQIRVRLVAQPADFLVAIEDLVPRERALAPAGFPGER